MKKIGAIVLITLFLNSTAFATVPPSQFIVKSLAAKRSGVKSLRIKSIITATDNKGQAKGPQLKETVWIDYVQHLLRSRMVDESGRELYAIERKLDANIPVGDLVLFDSKSEVLAKGLRQNGIPIRTEAELLTMKTEQERQLAETTSVARLKNLIAWVIGDPTSGSQLWIEKDTFLPLKVILKSDDKSQEIVFDGFRFVKEIPYPKVITLDGVHIESVEMLVNTDMSEMRSQVQPGFTDASESLDSSVKELIRRFYQLVR